MYPVFNLALLDKARRVVRIDENSFNLHFEGHILEYRKRLSGWEPRVSVSIRKYGESDSQKLYDFSVCALKSDEILEFWSAANLNGARQEQEERQSVVNKANDFIKGILKDASSEQEDR